MGGNPDTNDEAALLKRKQNRKSEGARRFARYWQERHEARRIDNQLRGFTRQGDPRSSSSMPTEDDLMRIFGGDRMKAMMKTLKLPPDVPIENRMISKSLESAQKKVEGNNFDLRKHLVEYDDVINKHREAIYRRRREILEASEMEVKEGENTHLFNLNAIINKVKVEITVIVFHTSGDKSGD